MKGCVGGERRDLGQVGAQGVVDAEGSVRATGRDVDLECEDELAPRVGPVLDPNVLVSRALAELALRLRPGMGARGGELDQVTGGPRELPPSPGERARGLADGRHGWGHDLELGRRQFALEPGVALHASQHLGSQRSQLTGLGVEQHQLLLQPDGELGPAVEAPP